VLKELLKNKRKNKRWLLLVKLFFEEDDSLLPGWLFVSILIAVFVFAGITGYLCRIGFLTTGCGIGSI